MDRIKSDASSVRIESRKTDGCAESVQSAVMLTATPHSGDEAAFYRLLGLLDRDFEGLVGTTGDERNRLRNRLSRRFVQRRRPDIAEWKEGNLFPAARPRS